MKMLTIIAMGILSANSLGYQTENINGRVAIAPEKITTFETIPNKNLEEFCERANSYIENFRLSLEQNNCLEDMNSSRTCHSIKRIYQRLATGNGVIGTNLASKLSISLHTPVFEELNVSNIANELGLDSDQILSSSSLKIKRLKEIRTTFSNPGNFELAIQVIGIKPVIRMERGEVYFNERLSACAFETNELAISGTIEAEGQVVDSIPQSAIEYLLRLKGSLKEAYLNHERLRNPEIDSHLRAFEVMRLGFDLAYLEEKIKESAALTKFPKMKSFGFMDSWWKHFFRTHPKRGTVEFKNHSNESIKELYPTEVFKINSDASFELSKGEF